MKTNNFKKMLSLFLVISMILSIASPIAFASTNTKQLYHYESWKWWNASTGSYWYTYSKSFGESHGAIYLDLTTTKLPTYKVLANGKIQYRVNGIPYYNECLVTEVFDPSNVKPIINCYGEAIVTNAISSRVNVYKSPSTNSQVVTTLKNGTSITYRWIFMDTRNGKKYYGYPSNNTWYYIQAEYVYPISFTERFSDTETYKFSFIDAFSSKEQRERLSSLIGFIPLVGDASDLASALSGKDYISGENLDAYARVLAFACVVVPVVSSSALRHSDELLDATKASLKKSDELANTAVKKLKVTSIIPNNVPSIAFNSKNALIDYLGKAGPGYEWHHIVEQAQIGKRANFSVSKIQNTANIIKLPAGSRDKVHNILSALYSSKTAYSGNKTVRDWLASKSFDEQFKFGLDQIRKYGSVTATKNGWVFTPYN